METVEESLTTVIESSSSSAEIDKDKVSGSGLEEESASEGSVNLGGGAVVKERTRSESVSSDASCKTPIPTTSLGGIDKINILLKPVGDAPILKQKLWSVPSERLVSQVTEFVKKYLKLDKNQNLFFFVNQLFAPSPDQCIRDLYECFGSDRKLVLHYSTTVAWG